MHGRSVSIPARDFAGKRTRITLGPVPGPAGDELIRIIIDGTILYTTADDLAQACVYIFGQACEGKHGRKE